MVSISLRVNKWNVLAKYSYDTTSNSQDPGGRIMKNKKHYNINRSFQLETGKDLIRNYAVGILTLSALPDASKD